MSAEQNEMERKLWLSNANQPNNNNNGAPARNSASSNKVSKNAFVKKGDFNNRTKAASNYGAGAGSGGGGRNALAFHDKRPTPRAGGRVQNNYGVGVTSGQQRQTKQVASADALFSARPYSKKELRYGKYDSDIVHTGNHHRNTPKAHNYGSTYYNDYRVKSFNKERYLQANCQFIVINDSSYDAHLVDPDQLVQWENIEEMRMATVEPATCPICLSPPVAAKITKCGHVYCWPCLLHYLALSDKKWRKCPICFESIYADQLKSFLPVPVSAVRAGSELELRLMCRQRGSVIVNPVLDQQLMTEKTHVTYGNDQRSQFAKLLLADYDNIKSDVLNRERRELELKYDEDRDEPEACFIVQALRELDDREQAFIERKDVAKKSTAAINTETTGAPKMSPPKTLPTAAAPASVAYLDAFNDIVEETVDEVKSNECASSVSSRESVDSNSATALDSPSTDATLPDAVMQLTLADAAQVSRQTIGQRKRTNSSDDGRGGDHTYYFYQASDGQAIYLHPLNARCIIHQYGSLSAGPLVIRGEVLQTENMVMSEMVRQRFRYMTHVPLGTCFTLVEMKFAEGILSPETELHFAPEFARRDQERKKRARSETRRQHRAEQLDRALLLDPANYPKYVAQKEEITPEDFPSIHVVASAQGELESGWNQNPVVGETEQQPQQKELAESVGVAVDVCLSSPPSFAQMLRQGKPKTVVSSSTPVEKKESNDAKQATQPVDNEPDMPAPSYASAWGDALDSAFSSLVHNKSTGDLVPSANGGGGKASKKKKKKQVVLFST